MRAGLAWVALLVAACGESGEDGGSAGSGGSGGGAGTGGAAGSVEAGAGTGGGAGCAAPDPEIVDPETSSEIVVVGDPGAALGTFDFSPVYPLGAPGGALSYSAVAATDDIASRIAVSPDAGATWLYVASANSSQDVTVTADPSSARCPGGSCSGRLVHEVSSLAFDPLDPEPARLWKLVSHSYVVLPGDELAYDYGYISLFTAAKPEGPWSFEGKLLGWSGEATLSSEGAWNLAGDAPELADCVALTEPSLLPLADGTLRLALGCATASQTIRIVLFESADHAKTLSHRSTLLDGQAALCAGSSVPQYNAAHLFFAAGKQWLLASLAGSVAGGFAGYRGCHLYELDGAAVRPGVVRAFDAAGERFNGACAYAEGATELGLVVSILRLDAPPRIFRTYRSGATLP